MSSLQIKGLYAIVDTSVTPAGDLINLATEYAEGGVSVIQLRDKSRHESPQHFELFRQVAVAIADLRKKYSFLFLVNDEPGVARDVQADGVHVGKDDFSIEDCRRLLGSKKIIGYSSHSLEEALDAERRGASYVAFGAIYPTPTKGPGHPVQGTQKLETVVRSLKCPVVAIGGIVRENVNDVIATGVDAIAMISGLAKASHRAEEVRFYQSLFGQSLFR